jgi:hypothetical protein
MPQINYYLIIAVKVKIVDAHLAEFDVDLFVAFRHRGLVCAVLVGRHVQVGVGIFLTLKITISTSSSYLCLSLQ